MKHMPNACSQDWNLKLSMHLSARTSIPCARTSTHFTGLLWSVVVLPRSRHPLFNSLPCIRNTLCTSLPCPRYSLSSCFNKFSKHQITMPHYTTLIMLHSAYAIVWGIRWSNSPTSPSDLILGTIAYILLSVSYFTGSLTFIFWLRSYIKKTRIIICLNYQLFFIIIYYTKR